MIFKTFSGSTYELDETNKRIRRLYGKNNPQPRQGNDGDWKEYVELVPSSPQKDCPVIIVWRYEGTTAVSTQTSLVAEIVSTENFN